MAPLYSTGTLASALGISRDSVINYLRSGMPEPSIRVAGRRAFNEEDVAAVCRWLDAHDKPHRKIASPVNGE